MVIPTSQRLEGGVNGKPSPKSCIYLSWRNYVSSRCILVTVSGSDAKLPNIIQTSTYEAKVCMTSL